MTYQLNPVYVPAVFAAVAAGHFLPYVWLHRTKIYGVLSVGVSLGVWLMMSIWGAAAFACIPIALGIAYYATALVLRRTLPSLTSIAVD